MHSIATDSVTSLMDFLRAKTPEDWARIEVSDEKIQIKRKWKPWTDEDTKEMLDLKEIGHSLECIGPMMGRPVTTVRYHYAKHKKGQS